jgi:serine/threonine protein kinase
VKLEHPNIVNIHESGQKDGLFYFVMEFVDGLNLRQLLNTDKIAPSEALAIVPQICDALQYAHDQGIVHRDIKPENILLNKSGNVKIADFGLAKLVGLAAKDLTITGKGDVMGTPHYTAPEQLEHPSDVDHRADIYSLGVVFYQMLTGELPLGKFAPPSRKVQIDVRLDEVVLRALEKDSELRYPQASEVRTRVETILTTKPPVVRADGVDYKSKWTLFGLPLVHVATGVDPGTRRPRVAKGIIAIGNVAFGVVALGRIAGGGFAIGGLSIATVAFGGCAVGGLAIGGFALAMGIAVGGLAIAPIAMGGGAVGYLS